MSKMLFEVLQTGHKLKVFSKTQFVDVKAQSNNSVQNKCMLSKQNTPHGDLSSWQNRQARTLFILTLSIQICTNVPCPPLHNQSLIVLPSRIDVVDGSVWVSSAIRSRRTLVVHNVKLIIVDLGLAHHLEVPAHAAGLTKGLTDGDLLACQG
jgi:hypothetical protein